MHYNKKPLLEIVCRTLKLPLGSCSEVGDAIARKLQFGVYRPGVIDADAAAAAAAAVDEQVTAAAAAVAAAAATAAAADSLNNPLKPKHPRQNIQANQGFECLTVRSCYSGLSENCKSMVVRCGRVGSSPAKSPVGWHALGAVRVTRSRANQTPKAKCSGESWSYMRRCRRIVL